MPKKGFDAAIEKATKVMGGPPHVTRESKTLKSALWWVSSERYVKVVWDRGKRRVSKLLCQEPSDCAALKSLFPGAAIGKAAGTKRVAGTGAKKSVDRDPVGLDFS